MKYLDKIHEILEAVQGIDYELDKLIEPDNMYNHALIVITDKAADAGDAIKADLTSSDSRFWEIMTKYMKLLEFIEDIKQIKSELEALKGSLSYTLIPEYMDERKMKTVTIDELGVRVSTTSSISAKVASGMKDEAFAYLEKIGHGDEITRTINASTLSRIAREMMEENKELPEEIFNTDAKRNISVTKVKAK